MSPTLAIFASTITVLLLLWLVAWRGRCLQRCGITPLPESPVKTPPGPAVKLSVRLSPDVVDALRQIATRRGITMTEAFRDAIGAEKFLRDHEDCCRFLIEDKHGNRRQVTFR